MLKKYIQHFSLRQIILVGAGFLCILAVLGITIWEGMVRDKLYDQQMAKRWSKEDDVAQVSCFFTEEAVTGTDYFMNIAMSVDKALREASIAAEDGARLWADAYSRPGTITISNGSKSVELGAIGCAGEFFLFHPLQLINGSFFGPDSMMQDGIVIDEETAWQLFGSSDVAGMEVLIGQIPHYIAGVVKRGGGRINEAAGLSKSICYLPLESLQKYGQITGGYCYEIVLPNPVKGFAKSTVTTVLGKDKKGVETVDNTNRFSFLALIEVIQGFGIRSMSKEGIIYPYWENVARGHEDILALTLLIKLAALILPCLLGIIFLIRLWKRKTWTVEKGYHWLKDYLYDLSVKRKKKQNSQD